MDKRRRIRAIACIVILLVSGIIMADVKSVYANDAPATGRKTIISDKVENAVPGTTPDNIPSGYIFAGWFSDENCKTALEETGAGYAKFVDENVLRVKAQITAGTTAAKDTADIRFITTVDSLQYQNVGFAITIFGNTRTIITKNVYPQLYAVKNETNEPMQYSPDTSFSSVSTFFKAYTVKNVPQKFFGTTMTVQAMWTTLDGTVVYGTPCYKTIDMGLFETSGVDWGTILNCDSKDYAIEQSGVQMEVSAENYKEGCGSLRLEATGNAQVLFEWNRGENGLQFLEYSDWKLHFWLYIEDTTKLKNELLAIELTSSGTCDSEELQWNIAPSEMQNGWREYELKISDAIPSTNSIDFSKLNYIRILTGESSDKTGLVMYLDDVRMVSDAMLFNCDSLNQLAANSGSNGTCAVTNTEYRQGIGALACANSDLVWYQLNRTDNPANISAYAGGNLHFWLYINDIEKLGTSNVSVELGSAGTSDNEELEWWISPSKLKTGWNEVSLSLAAPDGTSGTVDYESIDHFRIFQVGSNKELSVVVDDVRITGKNSQVVDTLYGTEDVVVADILPKEMGYAVDSTGVADSTEAIQQALDDCATNGGGTVFLSKGTYKITQPITIPAYVTLRGDWQDSDTGTEYGTIVSVEVKATDTTDSSAVKEASQSGIFNLGGSGGVVGLTIYYPQQSVTDVKVYPYTFYTDGQDENYMLSTVKNVTVINGYRGIGATTKQGILLELPFVGTIYNESAQAHESLQIENFKGTFLESGIELYNSADVGSVKDVVISNAYWKQYDNAHENSLDETALDTYTKTNTTGLRLGDVEWTQFSNISVDMCNIGINTVTGRRTGNSSATVQFTGSFYNTNITNCNVGLQVDKIDTRWGVTIAGGSIMGSTLAIDNNTEGLIKLCDVSIEGSVEASTESTIITETASGCLPDIDDSAQYVKPSSNLIYAKLYDSAHEEDVSEVLQFYLNRAEKMGGGVVYVPAGTYYFTDNITVPEGVELRGSSSVATRDQFIESDGTLFLCSYGDESLGVEDTAFITLAGENAGLNGIRMIYPQNGPTTNDTDNQNLDTTYAVRGTSEGVYIVNSMISAAAYGVDFRDCDNHLVKNVVTCCYYNAYRLGGNNGTITGCLQNGTVLVRTQASVNSNNWISEDAIFKGLFYPILKPNHDYIILDNAEDELVYHNFAYGVSSMIINTNSENTKVVNIGTDKVGFSGSQIVMDGGSLFGINIMRCDTRTDNDTTELKVTPIENPENSKLYEYISGSLQLQNCMVMKNGGTESADEASITPYIWSGDGTETAYTGNTLYEVKLEKAVDIEWYQEGGLQILFYINDVDYLDTSGGLNVELTSSGSFDVQELEWNIYMHELQDGWNTLELEFAHADNDTKDIAFSAVNFIRIYQHGTNQNAALRTILKSVRAIGAKESGVIMNCDSMVEIIEQSRRVLSVTKTEGEFVEGTGAFKYEGVAQQRWNLLWEHPVDASMYENKMLHLWLYVDDMSKWNGPVCIELSSTADPDEDALEWRLDQSTLQDGWNELNLKFTDVTESLGTFDASAITLLRVYQCYGDAETSMITMLDDVYIREAE